MLTTYFMSHCKHSYKRKANSNRCLDRIEEMQSTNRLLRNKFSIKLQFSMNQKVDEEERSCKHGYSSHLTGVESPINQLYCQLLLNPVGNEATNSF